MFDWRSPSRSNSALVAGAAAAVAAASLLLSRPPFLFRLPFPRCLFRWATGWPCPSCGMTRGLIALGHGRVGQAFYQNLMSPLVFASLAAIVALSLYEAASGRFILRPFWDRIKSRVLIAVLILASISWAWNILKKLKGWEF